MSSHHPLLHGRRSSSYTMEVIAPLRTALLAVFLILYYGSCSCMATDTQPCYYRCGVHNISYPFRLKDSPDECGDPRYNLTCEDNNQLMLYLEFGKYNVQSISYNNYTIRVVDVNLQQLNNSSSSLPPPNSLTINNLSFSLGGPYQVSMNTYRLMNSMSYVSCPNGVEFWGLHVNDSANCMNSSSNMLGNSFFVNVDDISLWDLGLPDSCRIEFVYVTSWPGEMGNGNVSCRDIHDMLLYGFELSWVRGLCKNRWLWDGCSPPDGFPEYLATYTLMSILVLYSISKFGIGVPGILFFLIYKWRRRHLSIYDSIEGFLRSDNNIMPLRYSYKDIKRITKGFKTKLGNGGYSSVFKGQLRSGRFVAVKVLDKAKANGQDFINEVATIGRIHHVNVVQLIGFCVEGSKRALIYEFMPNGSLEKYIFSHEESSSLSCEKLYIISLGVARGIEYLHNGCNMKILHFDIKPHNILLDENFNPKVSDFGLARFYPTSNNTVSLTAVRGTIGYMAPELFYRNVGTVSYKADVYSFGMLLMEIASRRKNFSDLAEQSSQAYFPFWVYNRLYNGNEISNESDKAEEMKLIKKMMIVALWCIQTKPNDRPSMDKVLKMLQEDEELPMPNKPYLYSQDLPAEDVIDYSSSWPSSDISIGDSKE